MSLYRLHVTASRQAQRLLRSRHTVICTRCFSGSPCTSAQHEDDSGSKRPAGMSDLEWMQRQHYERWRKRLMDNPYRSLFGASNDMLSGKGLKDWAQWSWFGDVPPKSKSSKMERDEDNYSENHRKRTSERSDGYSTRDQSFMHDEALPRHAGQKDSHHVHDLPNNEVFPNEVPIQNKHHYERHGMKYTVPRSESESPRDHLYPKIVRIQDDDHAALESSQQSTERIRYGKAWLRTDDAGIASPSDSRWLPDPPLTREVSDTTATVPVHQEEYFHEEILAKSTNQDASQPTEASGSSDQTVRLSDEPTKKIMNNSTNNSMDREPACIETYLSKQSQNTKRRVCSERKGIDWRQTTLERRVSVDSNRRFDALQQESQSSPATEKINPVMALSPNADTVEKVDDFATFTPDSENGNTHRDKIEPKPENNMHQTMRPSSQALESLPENDLDLLSAADVRASMGRGRRKTLDRARNLSRSELDKSFRSLQQKKILDDIMVLNIAEKVRQPRKEHEASNRDPQKATPDTSPKVNSPADEIPAESIGTCMAKWLKQGSTILNNHFWQDPTEEADVKKTRLFFDKVVVRIQKGRNAMSEVIDDVKKDIPASKPLLNRLKKDERLLDETIHTLRKRLTEDRSQVPSLKKLRSIQLLRMKFQDTDRELEKAYKLLREAQKNISWNTPCPAFCRRLNIASKISHKNVQLTRYLVWSLQARLDDSSIKQSSLGDYKDVANSLLTLRDTQIAVTRLIDQAMSTYGVVSTLEDGLKILDGYDMMAMPIDTQDTGKAVSSTHEVNVSQEEVSTGDLQADKPPSKYLDQQNPLVHSLFRPFTPILEQLGMKSSEQTSEAAITSTAEETPKPVVEAGQSPDIRDDYIESTRVKIQPLGLESETIVNQIDAADSPLTCAFDATTVPHSKITERARKLNLEFISNQTGSERNGQLAENGANANLPTRYTILLYDVQTDDLSLTISTTGPPRDTSPTIPLHQALSTLDTPAKFIPYITDGLEVITAKNDMLILRDALDSTSSTRTFEAASAPPSSPSAFLGGPDSSKRQVNHIDGTSHLSPTGYVPPEESQEQLEQEFQERRQAADQLYAAERIRGMRTNRGFAMHRYWTHHARQEQRQKRRGGVGGVLRTAIWATALCYIMGVVGEICTS